jgi:protein gp37
METVPFAEISRRSVTWNPWHGCHRVSEGCRNCFMFAGDGKRGVEDSNVVRRSKTQFDLPLKKDRSGRYLYRDCVIGTCMTSDFFIEEADEWRDEVWEIIRRRKDCTFMMTTKRPQRIMDCLPSDWGDGYPNVRFAVSTENQRAWDERIPILCSVPVRYRDVFMSPMIGPIDTDPLLDEGGIDCIYVGGEYGPGSRVCDYDWVLKVRESCIAHGVSFHWHNSGENLIMDGKLMTGLTISQQDSICDGAKIDYLVDGKMPGPKQMRLF